MESSGMQRPGGGTGDDGYDEDGYDESQRAEILEVTGQGPTDGTIMTDLAPDIGGDDEVDDDDDDTGRRRRSKLGKSMGLGVDSDDDDADDADDDDLADDDLNEEDLDEEDDDDDVGDANRIGTYRDDDTSLR